MDFETLVRERRSIRGYKKDPVPREVIEEVIEIAKGAPSSMNTQPWFFSCPYRRAIGAHSRGQYPTHAGGRGGAARDPRAWWI